MDFYKDVGAYKKNYKITNAELAEVIGKKEAAYQIAVKRESLSQLEIDKLTAYLLEKSGEKQQKPTGIKITAIAANELCTDGAPDLQKVARFVFSEIDSLMEFPEIQAIKFKWKYEALREAQGKEN